MKTLSGALLALCLFILVGCASGGGEKAVIGKWKGEFKVPESQKDNPLAKMAEGMMGLMSMDIEFKADHTFTLTAMMMPISGDWSMSGNEVTILPKTVMGLTPEEAAKLNKNGKAPTAEEKEKFEKGGKLELSSDGKTLKAIGDLLGSTGNSAPPSGEMVFTKKE